MLFRPSLYIDLGTANTIIYGKQHGFVLNEPSVLAYRERGPSRAMLAFGRAAKDMLGRNPEHIDVIRPLREGVIADFDGTTKMLMGFIQRIKKSAFLFRPDILVSLPFQVTPYEKDAVKEVALSVGASRVRLIDEPLAAAIGADLPIKAKRGMMVVDIGGGTTEIAVIACGGVVLVEAVRTGGNDMDLEILGYVRNQFNFLMGEQMSEQVKIAIGNAYAPFLSQKRFEVGGFDFNRGLPCLLKLTADDIFPPIDGVVRRIVVSIKKALENIPPETAGDIADHGIVLTGGGALLQGLRERISEETGLFVSITKDPLLSVAIGGAKALEDRALLEFVAS